MKDFFNEIQCTEGLQRQKQLEERKECLEDIQDISKRVSSLKKLTAERSGTMQNDHSGEEQQEEFLSRIQSVMERIEKQCIVFKQTRRQMLQTLNTEEKILMKEIKSFEGLIDDPDWLKEKEEPECIFTNPEKMKAVKQYIEQRENLRVPMEVIDYDVSVTHAQDSCFLLKRRCCDICFNLISIAMNPYFMILSQTELCS